MFHIGRIYKDREGTEHKVMMHNLHGKFPLITIDKKGKFVKYTREGQFYEKRASDKDLINE